MAQAPALIKGAALRFVEQQYGGPVQETEGAVTTDTAVVSVCGNDPERVNLTFVNLGAQQIAVGLSPDVSLTKGILLNAGGGLFNANVLDDATLPSREWFAVSPGGASVLYKLLLSRYSESPG